MERCHVSEGGRWSAIYDTHMVKVMGSPHKTGSSPLLIETMFVKLHEQIIMHFLFSACDKTLKETGLWFRGLSWLLVVGCGLWSCSTRFKLRAGTRGKCRAVCRVILVFYSSLITSSRLASNLTCWMLDVTFYPRLLSPPLIPAARLRQWSKCAQINVGVIKESIPG